MPRAASFPEQRYSVDIVNPSSGIDGSIDSERGRTWHSDTLGSCCLCHEEKGREGPVCQLQCAQCFFFVYVRRLVWVELN